MKHSREPLRGFSLLMLAGAFSYLAGPAFLTNAQGTIVRLDPTNAVVGVGSTVSVDIRVENVTDLYLADIVLHFNPAALEVLDADPGIVGVQIQPGTFLGTNASIESNSVDNDTGEIEFRQVVADDTVNGSGVLATITFKGKMVGTWNVTFDTSSVLEDTQGPGPDYTIEGVTFQTGSIIVSTTSPTATLTITPSPTYTSTPGPSPTPTSGLSPTSTDTPTPEPSPTSTSEAVPTITPETPSVPSPLPTSAPSPTPLPTATTEGVLYYRVMQVWPDRSMGAASAQLEGPTEQAAILPFGVYSAPTGEIVRARTYLHFPLDVFPLGSEILRATLYMYVDSGLGAGEATFGAYRVLEPWTEVDWGRNPSNWPTLLASPIALTTARSDTGLLAPLAAVPAPLATSTPTPTPTVSAPTAEPRSTPTPPTSPLGLPASPLDTPVPSTPTPTLTAQPTASPTPTPLHTQVAVPGAAASVVSLQPIAGTWLAWDITALARAWLKKEATDYGLALAAAPNPDAGPEAAGNLLVARQFSADDPTTRPYLIVQIAVHPVTPTPVILLPRAGNRATERCGDGMVLFVVGVILLALGLMLQRRQGTSKG